MLLGSHSMLGGLRVVKFAGATKLFNVRLSSRHLPLLVSERRLESGGGSPRFPQRLPPFFLSVKVS